MKCKGLRALYLHYCYELHIIVKHPASVKRVPFLLYEDVRKMEQYIVQTQLLGREAVDRLKSQITDLSAQIVVARKEIGLCSENRERSEQVARKLIDINKQLEEVEKTHEYSRRFGRPNREDVPQWSSVWPRDRKPLGPPASLQKPSALFRCAAWCYPGLSSRLFLISQNGIDQNRQLLCRSS